MDLDSEHSGTLPLDLLFLKLPFAVWPGLTDSRVRQSEGLIIKSYWLFVKYL